MRHLESAKPTIAAFEAVGVSRPVALTTEQKRLLIEVIESWGGQVQGGLTNGLPEGVFELRNALHDDLHDAQQRHGRSGRGKPPGQLPAG
jgi:hypothetical protein